MQGLEGMIQDVNTKIQYTDTKLKDLKKLEDQISQKSAVRSTLVNEREEKHKALEEENEDTDEELKEWKTKFEEKIALLETKIRKLEREENDAESKITFLEKTLKESIWEISKLENEAEVHLCSKNERDSVIQKLFSRHNLGALPNPPFSNEVALNLTNRIKSRLLDLEKDLQDKKRSNEKELETTWDCYNDAKDHWKSIEAQKEAKEEIKNGLLKRIEEKKNERDSLELEVSNVDLSHIDEKEKNMHIEFERKTNQYAEREFESTIRQKDNEMFSIEQMITVAKKEKAAMAVDMEDRTKLSMKKNDLENRKRQHRKIINENRERVRGVLKGRFPPEKDLRGEISQVLSAVTMEFDDLSTKSREAENEVNMLQTRIQEINNNIYKHRKDMDSKRRYIESKLQALDQQSFTVDYYPTVLDSAKEKRDVEKRKYNFADGMRQMFDPFERVARANHICPCCERPFSLQEEDEFVKKQRMNAASSAEKLKVLAAESSTADSFFQQLDRLRMVYEEYVNIGKERIPNAERELDDLTQEMEQKSQALDDVLAVSAQVKAEKDSIQALMEPIENADRLFQDIQREQKLVDELAHKLEQGHGSRSMQDIESELDNLLETKDNLHREVMKLRSEQMDLQDDLSTVKTRWHNVREEKIKAANLLSDVKRAEEELERLTEEKNRVDLDEKLLAESLRPLSKEKDKLLGYHNDLKVKLNREYDEQAERKREYEQEVEALNMINSKIKEYNDSKKGEKLQEIQEKQHLLESQLQSCKTRKKEILAELNKSKDLRANQDQVRRNIEDNLSYRKTKAEVEELTRELESLEDKMLKIGRKPKVQAELEKLSHEREEFLKRLNQNDGIISAHQSEISKHKIDLKNPDYKDIDKRYFDQLIQLKTTEMANKDLDRYYNALDKALMRFHSMKMEEINKIIRELWQQTYRGQDIDYICIHSDSDGAGTRSYSYKVLMQTGDTELEMRGRCSAGQKVLASLIIRLALAETFCLNCGILALDEPTTNLDGPNADSLAAALHRIMEDRKGQENFQLIVITHDERFAQLIGQRQHAEKYYRVAKDDHQHSIIEAQEIFD
ncbi:hypothetical protein ACFX15_030970 [Malus domestica]